MGNKVSVEETIRDIKRQTRRKYNAEEKIRIVLERLRAAARCADGGGLVDGVAGHVEQVLVDLAQPLDEVMLLGVVDAYAEAIVLDDLVGGGEIVAINRGIEQL